MFCSKCGNLSVVGKFGISCPRCGSFSYNDGVQLSEGPRMITSSGLAAVSLSVIWPNWTLVHPEFEFLRNQNRAFLLMEQDFPKHIWHSNVDSRLYYAFGLFILAGKFSERLVKEKLNNRTLSVGEEVSLSHLKKLIYGIQHAKEHFDPRFEGEHTYEFVKAASLIHSILYYLGQKWERPVLCEVCGLMGDGAELRIFDDGTGCADCDGQVVPFDLERERFFKEMSAIESSKLIRKTK